MKNIKSIIAYILLGLLFASVVVGLLIAFSTVYTSITTCEIVCAGVGTLVGFGLIVLIAHLLVESGENEKLIESLDEKCDRCIDRNKKDGAKEFCEYANEKIANVVECGTGKSITLDSLLLGYINGKDNSGKCD